MASYPQLVLPLERELCKKKNSVVDIRKENHRHRAKPISEDYSKSLRPPESAKPSDSRIFGRFEYDGLFVCDNVGCVSQCCRNIPLS